MNRRSLRNAVRSVALALVVPGLFVHQADMATVQGEAIFAHALKVLQNDAYARYAKYDVVVTFTNGARHVDTWATTEDMTHASVYADIFSQQERADPYVPTGVNVGIGVGLPDASPRSLGANNGTPSTQTLAVAPISGGDSSDPVGPVAFAVDQNFGLTDPRPYVVVQEGETFSSRADGFTTIGRTGVNEAPRYHVVLVDTNGNVAHLKLTPLRDAFRNRLRELWVETDTGYVHQAIVDGVGDRSPIVDGRFRVTFVRQAGGTYISKIESITPIHFGDNDDVSDLTFTFENLTLTSDSPKYRFGISTPEQTLHDP